MLAGIITDYAFGVGYMLLAGIAYLIRDWRKLQLAISAPGFLLVFYIWWGEFICLLNMRLMVNLYISDSLFCPLLLALHVRVLPQSARWLLTRDRREEAIALLRKVALVNGQVLPPTLQVRIGFVIFTTLSAPFIKCIFL